MEGPLRTDTDNRTGAGANAVVETHTLDGLSLQWRGSLISPFWAFAAVVTTALLGTVIPIAFAPVVVFSEAVATAAALVVAQLLAMSIVLIAGVATMFTALLARRTGRCTLSLHGLAIDDRDPIPLGREVRYHFIAHELGGARDVTRDVVADQSGRQRKRRIRCGLDIVIDGVRHRVARHIAATQALSIADALIRHWPQRPQGSSTASLTDNDGLDALHRLRRGAASDVSG